MPSYSVSASEIKYASGSSWTSGKARQGVYSSTRYEGALNFAGLANFSFSNIAVTGIQMRVTFGPTGGSSMKYLTLYGGAKNSISGSIASMRGSALGAVSVSNAFDRTVTLNFNSGSEAAIYDALVNFFASGNRVLILYVPKTRGTYSGGYCYDYLSVTAMTLTFTYEYLQSSGSMASTSVAAGSAAKLNITAYNSAYSHRVTWKFGDVFRHTDRDGGHIVRFVYHSSELVEGDSECCQRYGERDAGNAGRGRERTRNVQL